MQYYLPRRTYTLETRFFLVTIPAMSALMFLSWCLA